MNTQQNRTLGIMFRREHAPETLPDFARRAEAAGFGELWVVEDCFYGSGIASAATALACTSHINVGLGIMPAVARNPVFAAMEIATLARLYPGRFLPGLGHGVAEWMRQIGAFPQSQLRALEETTIVIRRLLAGEQVTFHGQQIHVEQACLVHPPAHIPPIALGVAGPKSLALSGRVADGTILSEYAAPAYVTWAREQIACGQREAGCQRNHRLTVFAFANADANADAARAPLRPMLADAIISGGLDGRLAAMGLSAQAHEHLNSAGQAQLAAQLPAAWIDQFAIAGAREDWQLAIERLFAAGADSIVLTPLPGQTLDEVAVFAQQLFA